MTTTPQATGLLTALLAVQAEAPKLLKSSTAQAGSFSYKYVDYADVMATVGPLLTEHGLVWSTFPTIDEQGRPALRYRLTHAATGESEQDTMPLMLSKGDAQGQGSAITYARRYSIIAVLNLVADEDDDGGRASNQQSAPQGEWVASKKQQQLILLKAREYGLPPSVTANVIKLTQGAEPSLFETEADGQKWLDRWLPELLAKFVTPVLENMEKEQVPA